jgi:hypothetical protein
MNETQKAAEKWADKHTKAWASFSEFVHLQQAFLAGVAWAYAHPQDPDAKLREVVDAMGRGRDKQNKKPSFAEARRYAERVIYEDKVSK